MFFSFWLLDFSFYFEQLNKKTLAYIFFAICIVIVGYLLYDTYRISTGNPDDIADEFDEELTKSDSDIDVVYDAYDISSGLNSALYQNIEDRTVFYFFSEDTECVDPATISQNENLVLTISLPLVTASIDSSATSTSVFIRSIEGAVTEISGIPDEANSLNLQVEEGKIKGSVDLKWDMDRYVEGEFEASECAI